MKMTIKRIAAVERQELGQQLAVESAVSLDQPLHPETALTKDTLSRRAFAEAAAQSFKRLSSSGSLVVSVEGAWGSGKSSALAMIEALLQSDPETQGCVIVHFNPWLIGDRDSLLRHFLARISAAVKLADHGQEGRRVAKELKAYAKVFDVLKLIPGAEPWASMVKSVVESVGDATASVAEHKTPDLEQQKNRVENALRDFMRSIVVFIDDVDRLFPLEVFEMIRIIKAVGGLPNVGYVVAWDSKYISDALQSVNVPQADVYLDKIVQVRMSLPSLSLSARSRLVSDALSRLPPDAHKPRFRDETRLSLFYLSGLRDIIEQPRDVTRVFNTVRAIEPALRGEICLSDIIGLAALMVKAPSVFELLRKSPSYFVGRLPNDNALPGRSVDVVKQAKPDRQKAYSECPSPRSVQRVVHFLFPMVAKAEGGIALGQTSDVDGQIAHPARLLVALQLNVSSWDASLDAVRSYLRSPAERDAVIRSLTIENCLEFLELMAEVAESHGSEGITDLQDLCLAIAALPETDPFFARAGDRRDILSVRTWDAAIRTIDIIVRAVDSSRGEDIARRIIGCERGLSVAADLAMRSYVWERNEQSAPVMAHEKMKRKLLGEFSRNVSEAAKSNAFFRLANPAGVLGAMSEVARRDCKALFQTLKNSDPTLDEFAMQVLRYSFDSYKGQTYSLSESLDRITAYCSVNQLKAHAKKRLADPTLDYPARAAWHAVIDGDKKFYAKDGSEVDR